MPSDFFDKNDIVEDDNFFDEQDLVEDSFDIEPLDNEMGAGEAGVSGVAQGATFGLSPILSGLMGAATEGAEDIADYAGLTTESQLEDQGFEQKDDYQGLEGLMQAYYDAREGRKAYEEKAFEDQPAANIAGNLVGGIGATVATGGLAGAGKVGQAASKILPQASNLKNAGLAQKIGVGVREGTKAGLLSGFGQGDAKLVNEEDSVLAETLGTGVAGGLLGGALPVIGSGLKKAKDLAVQSPFAKNIALGFKAGTKGIDISDDDQIVNYISNVTKDIKDSISKNFQGSSKKELLEQADEIGVRVNAGEAIEDVISDIQKKGAFNATEQKQLSSFIDDLRNLSIGEDVAKNKIANKIELDAAKKVNQQIEKGGKLVENNNFEKKVGDVLNKPDIEGDLLGTKNRVEFVDNNGTSNIKDLLSQNNYVENQVPIKKYDLDNLKLSETDEILQKIRNIAYPEGGGDASTGYAKNIYGKLREISNNAMESSSLPERNKKLKSLFDGLESLGIKSQDFFSKQEVVRDEVEKKIQQKLTASPLSGSDIDMRNFLKYLGRADDELAGKVSEQSKFALDLSKFARQSDAEGSVSIKSVAGPIQKILAKGGNLAGGATKGVSDFSKDASKALYNKMTQWTPEDAVQFGEKMTAEFGEKAKPYVNQIIKASGSQSQRKNALMYGIYQQPAFREMLERVGRNVIGEEEDDQE